MRQKTVKSEIRNKFVGKGNAWIKIPVTHISYKRVLIKLNEKEIETQNIRQCFEKAGYAWLRFNKPGDSNIIPSIIFELRYKGSKINHQDFLLEIPYQEIYDVQHLGSTPFKLKLEDLIENNNDYHDNEEILTIKNVNSNINKSILKDENIDIDLSNISGLKETTDYFDENKSNKNKLDYKDYVNQQLKNVKEVEFTNCTQKEFNDWIEFLKLEGIIKEENI